MIYLDTSAAVKLIYPEEHSASLVVWLRERPTAPLVASALLEVELTRSLRRLNGEFALPIATLLRGLNVISLTPEVLRRASQYEDQFLRSLDALHLASAQLVAEQAGLPLTAFVTYDHQLAAVASRHGLPVIAPGLDDGIFHAPH